MKYETFPVSRKEFVGTLTEAIAKVLKTEGCEAAVITPRPQGLFIAAARAVKKEEEENNEQD